MLFAVTPLDDLWTVATEMAHLQLFMHPGLALLKICFIVPLKGLVDVFRSISEGFRNMPALCVHTLHQGISLTAHRLGGTVRSPGPIDGIGTGLKEAGKVRSGDM